MISLLICNDKLGTVVKPVRSTLRLPSGTVMHEAAFLDLQMGRCFPSDVLESDSTFLYLIDYRKLFLHFVDNL